MLVTGEDRSFTVAVELAVTPALGRGRPSAVELVAAAHKVCPYSNATRGNIEVKLSANGAPVSVLARPPGGASRGALEVLDQQPLDRLRRVGEGPVAARRQHVDVGGGEGVALALRVRRRAGRRPARPRSPAPACPAAPCSSASSVAPPRRGRRCRGRASARRACGCGGRSGRTSLRGTRRQPARLVASTGRVKAPPGRGRLEELAERPACARSAPVCAIGSRAGCRCRSG